MRAPEMTAERDLETATERIALQSRDQRLTHGLEGADDLRRGAAHRAGRQPADVGAGHEGGPRAVQHRRAHRRIRAKLLHRGIDAVAHRRRDGVDRRIVDDDDADLVPTLGANRLCVFRHRWAPALAIDRRESRRIPTG